MTLPISLDEVLVALITIAAFLLEIFVSATTFD